MGNLQQAHNDGQRDRAQQEARPPRDVETIITEAIFGGSEYNPPPDPAGKEAYDQGWVNNH